MIITPTISDDTATYSQNFLRQVIINETMKQDTNSLQNWTGVTITDTGVSASPITNSIIIHKTMIANDIYFVTGEIQYLFTSPIDGVGSIQKDGFMACCRLGKLNDLTAWHINIGLMLQNIYDAGITAPGASQFPQFPDRTKKGGYRGMDIYPAKSHTYTDSTSGTSGTTQGVYVHTVGGITIIPTVNTKIPNALSTGGGVFTNPQATYAVHDQWFALPLDGVADGTTLDADLLGADLLAQFSASPNWTITQYGVWGELCVIRVSTQSQTGNLTFNAGAALIASAWFPRQVLFGNNFGLTALNFDNTPAVGGNVIPGTNPEQNGYNPYFYYDISTTDTQLVDTGWNTTGNTQNRNAILVGSGTVYENGSTSRGEQGFMQTAILFVNTNFGLGRAYTFGLTPTTYPSDASPISLQSQNTAAEQNSTDLVANSFFSHVQDLSNEQENEEMILLRFFSPGFVGGAYAAFTHVCYYYTNPSLLNTDLGQVTLAASMKQIGPLISCDTADKTWNPSGLYSEARGFQNSSLSNGYVFGNKIGRPDSDNVAIGNRSGTVDNTPVYSPDIRGFIGSYSPTNSSDAAFGTVVPYILAYDTNKSDTIVPDYVNAVAGTWSVTATGSCFVTASTKLNEYLANSTPATPTLYQQGGIMDASYDVVRNQWVLSLSGNRDGVTFNTPAAFVAGDSALGRFSYFKKDGVFTPVLAQRDATTSGGQDQSTSFLYVATAGNTDKFKAFTLGGNFTSSADGVGGGPNNPSADPPTTGTSGPIQLTELEGASGRSVIMWVDYILFDGLDSMIATKVQEMGLRVTIENVEWYKRKLLHNDELNITTEEIEKWAQEQQQEYKDMLITKEREGRLRRRRKQQSNVAHDLEETLQGEFQDTTVYDFLDGDFIERNIKDLSAFPDQDDQLKNQIITDEQFTELDSLYGPSVAKKETLGEKLQEKLRRPKTPKKGKKSQKDDAEQA